MASARWRHFCAMGGAKSVDFGTFLRGSPQPENHTHSDHRHQRQGDAQASRALRGMIRLGDAKPAEASCPSHVAPRVSAGPLKASVEHPYDLQIPSHWMAKTGAVMTDSVRE